MSMVRLIITIAGLSVAALLLLPIVGLGDPRQDADGTMRAAVVWLSLAASALVGSLAVSVSLSPWLKAGRYRVYCTAGMIMIALSVALYIISFFFVRSSTLLASAPLSLAGIYVGGALFLTGVQFARKRRTTG